MMSECLLAMRRAEGYLFGCFKQGDQEEAFQFSKGRMGCSSYSGLRNELLVAT